MRRAIAMVLLFVAILVVASPASADPPLHCAVFPRVSPILAVDGQDTQVSVDCGIDGMVVHGVTFTVDSGPAHGTVTQFITDDTETWFHYRPTPGYRGADSFTLHATDDAGHVSAPVTVTLTVDHDIDCLTNTYPATPTFPIPLRNDAFFQVGFVCSGHEAGDDFALQIVRAPAHGHFSELDDTVDTNIRATYVPDPNYVGPDEFWVRVLTGRGGGSMTQAYVFDVQDAATNHPPECRSSPIAIGIGGVYPVDELCRDPDGDPLSYRMITGPQHGTANQMLPGVFMYVAAAGFNGWDSFTYGVSDGRSEVQRYVGIQVGAAPVDPAPSAAGPPVPPAPPAPPPVTAPAVPKGLKRATGVTLGDIEAYVPTHTARLGKKATQVLVLRTVIDGVVDVRPSLRAGGRTITFKTQHLRVDATRLGSVRLSLDARTRRALRHVHRARLTLGLATKTSRDRLALTVRLR